MQGEGIFTQTQIKNSKYVIRTITKDLILLVEAERDIITALLSISLLAICLKRHHMITSFPSCTDRYCF